VSYANTARVTKTVSVATQADLTWVNKAAPFDLEDNKATKIDMDGTNDCDFVGYCCQTLVMLMGIQPRKRLIIIANV